MKPDTVKLESHAHGDELFDAYAGNYDAALAEGLRVTGEDASYFAQGRVAWMRRRLKALGIVPRRVLDFGCGTGGSVPYLLSLDGVEEIVGVDISTSSLDVARERHGGSNVRFAHSSSVVDDNFDIAFCNGVFHHIPVADRSACVEYVFNRLRPGGAFALWENNPWNPGVRYIMRRVAFDSDAIVLSPPETRRMLRSAGFEAIATSFVFVFPNQLRWLRGIERWVSRIPAGGQYLTIGLRPALKSKVNVLHRP